MFLDIIQLLAAAKRGNGLVLMTSMRSSIALLERQECCARPRFRLRRRRVRRRWAGARVNRATGVHQATGAQEENGIGRIHWSRGAVGKDEDEDELGSARHSRCWT
eukprot:13469-Pyramimonas_sp.AAC.1